MIETHHKHLGFGYYKLEVYYRFFTDRDTLIGHSTADGIEHINTAKYIVGDSLMIAYDPTNSSDTYVVEITYAKPGFK